MVPRKTFLPARTRVRLAPLHPKPVPFLKNRTRARPLACCGCPAPTVPVLALKFVTRSSVTRWSRGIRGVTVVYYISLFDKQHDRQALLECAKKKQ